MKGPKKGDMAVRDPWDSLGAYGEWLKSIL
jgi:hypothetical protein